MTRLGLHRARWLWSGLLVGGLGCSEQCGGAGSESSTLDVGAATAPTRARPRPPAPDPEPSPTARLARAARAGRVRLASLPAGSPEQRRNLDLGKAMLQAGDKETAAAHFQAAVQGVLSGPRISSMLALGDLLMESGRVAEAIGLHEEAARIAAGVPEVHLLLGRCYASAGRHADAEAALRQAVKLEPRLLAAYVDLAAVLNRQGRNDEAAKALLSYERHLFELVRLLREGPEDDRLAAVEALSLTADEKGVEALIATLDDPLPGVRGSAAEALGDAASAVALEAIRRRLPSERSEEVRIAMAQATQRLLASLRILAGAAPGSALAAPPPPPPPPPAAPSGP